MSAAKNPIRLRPTDARTLKNLSTEFIGIPRFKKVMIDRIRRARENQYADPKEFEVAALRVPVPLTRLQP